MPILEGIIFKAAGSTYQPGARNATWQKVECQLRKEFVIGGYEYSTVGSLGVIWLGYYLADGSLEVAGADSDSRRDQGWSTVAIVSEWWSGSRASA